MQGVELAGGKVGALIRAGDGAQLDQGVGDKQGRGGGSVEATLGDQHGPGSGVSCGNEVGMGVGDAGEGVGDNYMKTIKTSSASEREGKRRNRS
jgi:hypothetical protein